MDASLAHMLPSRGQAIAKLWLWHGQVFNIESAVCVCVCVCGKVWFSIFYDILLIFNLLAK